jgi:hypothetical protein
VEGGEPCLVNFEKIILLGNVRRLCLVLHSGLLIAT